MKKQLLLSLLSLSSLSLLSEPPPSEDTLGGSHFMYKLNQSRFNDPVQAIAQRYGKCVKFTNMEHPLDRDCMHTVMKEARDNNSFGIGDKMVEGYMVLVESDSVSEDERDAYERKRDTVMYETLQAIRAEWDKEQTEVSQLRDALVKDLHKPAVQEHADYKELVELAAELGITVEEGIDVLIAIATGIDTGIEPGSKQEAFLKVTIERGKPTEA